MAIANQISIGSVNNVVSGTKLRDVQKKVLQDLANAINSSFVNTGISTLYSNLDARLEFL